MSETQHDGQEATKQPKRKRRGWWWKAPLIVLALLAVVYGGWRYRIAGQLEDARQRIRDAGYPVTRAELNAYYPTPKGVNAAEIYQRAFDARVTDEELEAQLPDFSEVDWPKSGETLNAELATKIEQYLEMNRETLSLLAEAAQYNESRYEVDFTQGWLPDCPHLSNLRYHARLLSLKAMQHAHQGEAEEALQAIEQMFAVADSLKQEPTLISLLVRISIQTLAPNRLEMLMDHIEPDDAQINALSQRLSEADDSQAMERALVGERAIIVGIFENQNDVLGEDAGGITAMRFVGLLGRDQLAYMTYMEKIIEQVRDPAVEVFDEDAYIENLSEYYIVTRLLAPGFNSAINADKMGQAHNRSAVPALAAKRYQLRHGRWPDKLDDLVPEFLEAAPIDPFDDQPMRYKITETGGIVVYSIGQDSEDNGGLKENEETGGTNGREGSDIPFHIR